MDPQQLDMELNTLERLCGLFAVLTSHRHEIESELSTAEHAALDSTIGNVAVSMQTVSTSVAGQIATSDH